MDHQRTISLSPDHLWAVVVLLRWLVSTLQELSLFMVIIIVQLLLWYSWLVHWLLLLLLSLRRHIVVFL